jgi:hypothetical protein
VLFEDYVLNHELIVHSRRDVGCDSEGSRVSAEKMINSGYEFEYKDMKHALENVPG